MKFILYLITFIASLAGGIFTLSLFTYYSDEVLIVAGSVLGAIVYSLLLMVFNKIKTKND
jgi:lipid-A-disaccharide synthase-like uncharacterized protein